ncbi:RNA polymerase III subunit H isoform X2 [Tachypleus tridentatus]|uniref:RNA polymerase III subunit H isoform X2 n=1 Tax=Tachypleus tridentatus TaxID=6853 RepID=UPI003FD1189E
MFCLAEMCDNVRVPPWLFHLKLNMAVSEELNKKLANKVVTNVGLCIALYDVLRLEDSYIFPGDGASHTKVSLGFFDDILIPPDSLQHPSRFDETEQVWIWEYGTDDGKHDMFMDPGEAIRFRVVDETFVDTSPSGPEMGDLSENEEKGKRIPYSLTGSISEPGLGLLAWWS